VARLRLLAPAAGVLLAAAAQAAEAPAPAELQGTWRWVSFVSATDKLLVDKPDQYQLDFPNAGQIALKADCNRAAGGISFGNDGAMKIGPMAMTRAMCPPGSLSDRFVQEVGKATRWSKRDKDLLLELPSHAAILRFVKAP